MTQSITSNDAARDQELMRLAIEHSFASMDRSRKVGAIIACATGEVIARGVNEFPNGVERAVEQRHARPEKYFWTEHAERNAIYAAAKAGQSTLGATMYVPWFPCTDCARAIVQCGIIRLVATMPDLTDSQWGSHFIIASQILEEGGVQVTYLELR